MKSKNFAVVATTVLLAAVSVTLLTLRIGGCRGADLTTTVATRQLYQPAKGDTFSAVEDWPRWRGPRGDGISKENPGEAWPKDGLKRLWVADVGIGYASPVAAGGRVYLFSLNNGKDNLTCFDAMTGRVVWSDEAESGWSAAGSYEGTRATPTVVVGGTSGGDTAAGGGADAGSVYTYGGRGDLTCRSLADGKPRWRKDVLALTGTGAPQWGLASSPLVEGGKVFVQAGTGGPVAVALDAKTGEPAWKSEATGNGGYAAPIPIDVEGKPQLVVFAADAVIGMDPATGRTLWREAWTTSYGVNAATPVYRDGHLYVSSAYNMGGMMLKVTAAGATKLWAKNDIKSKFQPPILDGDLLVGNSDPGRLVGISWPDGTRKFRADDSALTLGMGGAFVRAAGDKLVTLSEDGVLSLSKVSPSGVELVSQFPATGNDIKVWSAPLLYGSRLYVKGPKELVCFELPK
jgi:outer membrane protein assembly factor BamB